MKSHAQLLATALALAALAGCATTPPAASGTRRFEPREGQPLNLSYVFLSEVDTGPVPVSLPKPEMTYDAQFAGTAAKVAVEVTVDAAGAVTAARAVSAEPAFAAEPVAASFAHARFRPALKQGVPVPCRMRVIYSFEL